MIEINLTKFPKDEVPQPSLQGNWLLIFKNNTAGFNYSNTRTFMVFIHYGYF